MAKKRDLSGPDWFRRLQSDPEWADRSAKRECARKAREKSLQEEQRPLLRDLRSVGIDVQSVYDLVNSPDSYAEAVPILLAHLRRHQYDWRIREGIARALTVPEAKHIVPDLLTAFRLEPDTQVNGAKAAIGNALDHLADERYIADIADSASDRQHGPARAALVARLGRSPSPLATEVLTALVDDPDVEVNLRARSELGKRSS